MTWCKYCGEYIGLFSLSYFCNFCSQLRRALLLLKKECINDLFEQYAGISLMEEIEQIEEPKEKPKEEKPLMINCKVQTTETSTQESVIKELKDNKKFKKCKSYSDVLQAIP